MRRSPRRSTTRTTGCGARRCAFRGAGQNMYIYPSIVRAYGGEWFNGDGKLVVNSEEGVAALE